MPKKRQEADFVETCVSYLRALDDVRQKCREVLATLVEEVRKSDEEMATKMLAVLQINSQANQALIDVLGERPDELSQERIDELHELQLGLATYYTKKSH